MKNPQSGKTYSDAMNAWQAQQSLFGRMRSRFFHPPIEATGVKWVWGYVWRYGLMLLVPLAIYAMIFQSYVLTIAFQNLLENEIKKYTHAASTLVIEPALDLDGELIVAAITMKGSKDSFFQEAKTTGLATNVGFTKMFSKAWHLSEVRCFTTSISLKSGAAGATPTTDKTKTDAPKDIIPPLRTGWNAPPLSLMNAGITDISFPNPGIHPDFDQLTIDLFKTSSLAVNWGGSPSTIGSISECPAIVNKTSGGWELVTKKGAFRQGWLEGLTINNLKVNIDAKEAVIERGDFSIFDSAGSLTGRITFGQNPDINASIKLERFPFHRILPVGQKNTKSLADFLDLQTIGTIDLNGSTNLPTGIQMKADLSVLSGKIIGLPVFKALGSISGDNQITQPKIVGGHIRFKTMGTGDLEGLGVEISDAYLDCGPGLKIKATGNWSRKLETDRAIPSRMQKSVKGKTVITTDVLLRIGILKESLASVRPSIISEFFTSGEEGCLWINVPVTDDSSHLTADIADRILSLDIDR